MPRNIKNAEENPAEPFTGISPNNIELLDENEKVVKRKEKFKKRLRKIFFGCVSANY